MTSNSLNLKKNIEADVLEWFLDNGIDEILAHEPVNKAIPPQEPVPPLSVQAVKKNPAPNTKIETQTDLMGTAQAIIEATQRAKEAQTLGDLQKTIAEFSGLSVKKTALNMVFCDGNPKADIMVIGEAPGADEDRQGKPFVGASGQLLDLILKRIGVTRHADDPHHATYISNILNWRPPGNRTPTPDEMKIALPFIERHIQLVEPKILLLVGNTPMKTILNTKEGIKKMRGRWHAYQTITPDLCTTEQEIYALPTFHPAFLLRNPYEKKTVWQDMILLQKKREELGLVS